jgi:2-polyprenyl-3-methyl-5-hydroxy-6-metoxy-1,4-benzoquinol methylase
MRCDACNTEMTPGLDNWHYVCKLCGLECSTLNPLINEIDSINEIEREKALKPIRENNFDELVFWLTETIPRNQNSESKKKLLDVGCAHGWFIERAIKYYDVLGIEPDKAIALHTQERKLPVRCGYFPEALDLKEKFDIIVFNDVLEHIPDVRTVLQECKSRLTDRGVVVINAPDNTGALYKVSKTFARIGRFSAFNRMWQKGLPSPHLYYFNNDSINRIANACGFEVIKRRQLPSIITKGLYSRINFARDSSKLRSIIMAACLVILIPLIKLLPSDISVWILENDKI